jgi:hypothetical protein
MKAASLQTTRWTQIAKAVAVPWTIAALLAVETALLWPRPSPPMPPSPQPAAAVSATDPDNPPISAYPLEDHLRFSFLNHGVTLDYVTVPPWMMPANHGIRVKNGAHVFILKSLDQLSGLVHIDTSADALRFAQLMTSRAYAYNYDAAELEILSYSQSLRPPFKVPAKFLGPNFLVPPGKQVSGKRPFMLYIDPAFTVIKLPSGWLGVLADHDYHAGAFTAPVTQKTPDGFQIERWICCLDREIDTKSPPIQLWTVQRWRETVSPSGVYHRQVIVSKPARKYGQTTLYLPSKI